MTEDVHGDGGVEGSGARIRHAVGRREDGLVGVTARELHGALVAIDAHDFLEGTPEDGAAGPRPAPEVQYATRTGELFAGELVEGDRRRGLGGEPRVGAAPASLDANRLAVGKATVELRPRSSVEAYEGHFAAFFASAAALAASDRTTVVKASRIGPSTRTTSSIASALFFTLAVVNRSRLKL